jgi:hypothetical protein
MKGITAAAVAAAMASTQNDGTTPDRDPAVVPTRNSWRWSIAKALPLLLLPFLGPNAILTTTTVVQDEASTNQNQNHHQNHNHDDRHYNRQLLEHGLRGGTEGGGGGDNDTEIDNNSKNNKNSQKYGKSNDRITPIPVANTTISLHAHSGSHHVHLYIGSPPQRQTLIIDTGSRAMAFPCSKSNGNNNNSNSYKKNCCGVHASPYFDPSKSTTHIVSNCGSCLLEGISSCPFHQLLLGGGSSGSSGTSDSGSGTSSFGSSFETAAGCTFSQKYTEGSAWTATEVEDLVWLGSSDVLESVEEYMPALAVAYPFGCQTSSTGLFRKQYADGILGLSIHETSLVKAFHNEGLIRSNAFSLCFTPKGGVLSLGGSLDPHKYHYTNSNTNSNTNTNNSQQQRQEKSKQIMKTTPVTKQNEHGYYSVEVIRLVVGGTIVVTDADTTPRLLRDMNSGKGCILDSGTTDSYFPASLARSIRRAVIEYGKTKSMGGGDHTDHSRNHIQLDNTIDDDYFDLFSSKWRHKEYTYHEFQTLLPVVTVVFANEVALDILPQHYMEYVPLNDEADASATSGSISVMPWEGTLALTNRLYFDEHEGSVLGANAFFGYDILFDAGGDNDNDSGGKSSSQQEARIGIALSDCNSAARDVLDGGLSKTG